MPRASTRQYETIQINLNNYWRGHWPLHPVQLHLHGMPDDLIVKVISRFRRRTAAPGAAHQELRGLAACELRPDVRRAFPDAVHAEVPHDHGRQHEHGLAGAANLSSEPRRSAARRDFALSAPHVHYITHFRYPSAGGFVTYLNKFVPLGNLKLNHELVHRSPQAGIDVLERT